MAETILLVEDEATVRKTFQEWLGGSGWDLEVLAAPDAEQALAIASRKPIDLAILDWNLGAGQNGLQLLEDLHVFQPDVVSVLITGYANKATPLDALRLGVRDYLDKNHELTRERFLATIGKQLEKVRPIKRERDVKRRLERFRAVVKDALPKLETVAALHAEADPWADTIQQVLSPLCDWLQAKDAQLIVRRFQSDLPEPEQIEVYGKDGKQQSDKPNGRFSQSIAAAILSMAPECLSIELANSSRLAGITLSPWESSHRYLLGIGLNPSPSVSVVLQLVDKQNGKVTVAFTAEDREKFAAVEPFLKLSFSRYLGERASQEVLYRTLRTALVECENVADSLMAPALPDGVTGVSDVYRQSLSSAGAVPPELMAQLAEVIQNLAKRHGRSAVDHGIRMLSNIEQLLNEINQ